MKTTLIRVTFWLVTAAAIVMMFWPLIREFVVRIAEPPPADF